MVIFFDPIFIRDWGYITVLQLCEKFGVLPPIAYYTPIILAAQLSFTVTNYKHLNSNWFEPIMKSHAIEYHHSTKHR